MSGTSWMRIMHWGIRLLLVMLLGVITFTIVVLTVLPRATHAQALTVLTGSMTPSIPVGSVVVVRPVDPGTLHVGDVATYQKAPGKPEYITHRIVKIDTSTTPTTFTFKGDANRGPDINPVPASAIRGKVWFHVPYVGAIRDALHTKGGLAGVAMLLLAGYALYQSASALRDRGRTQAPVASEALAVDRDSAKPRFALLMNLSRDAFAGLDPETIARAFGTSLIESNEDTFTLLAAHADRARDALELIDAMEGAPPTFSADATEAADYGSAGSAQSKVELALPFEAEWNPLAPDHLGVLVAS